MCEYCDKEQDILRYDLEDEDETFMYLHFIDGCFRLSIESEYFEDDIDVKVNYCPMCGKKLAKT